MVQVWDLNSKTIACFLNENRTFTSVRLYYNSLKKVFNLIFMVNVKLFFKILKYLKYG